MVRKFVWKHKGAMLLVIGNLIFAGMGFYADITTSGWSWFRDTNKGKIFVGASGVVLLGTLLDIRRSEDIDDLKDAITNFKKDKALLEDQNAEMIKPEKIATIILECLVKDLNFSYTERITLFKHDDQQRCFQLIGRYSENLDFAERKRPLYPYSQGCISEAWNKGECYIEQLPDPEIDLERYVSLSKQNWKIPKDTSRNMSMRSRTYYGLVVKSKGPPSTNIGVIIFESLHEQFPKQLTRGKIKAKLEKSRAYDMLPWLVEQAALSRAMDEGY